MKAAMGGRVGACTKLCYQVLRIIKIVVLSERILILGNEVLRSYQKTAKLTHFSYTN